MTKEQILVDVQEAIAEKLGKEQSEITLDKSFKDDLGADSLEVMELVMDLEDKFEITIEDDQAENLKTVGDVVSYIETQV
ncbi:MULTISPECIES: acyl carrier protein [Exiguobacterium]|jgi:acyl carrier protein|uniref:Acyl carrier protein n=4 Tax=Exiguobacterium TaxID=33986 RepID=ACP_EXIS2|nr:MULTISPECIES: acyl carrier protein [Exiguobacterium]B1YIN3.1 RecName: Full=Acyl carrier protein; Short=ACP [Exiguobacterium sibiricum 255-15]ACB61359.1 acyl carrier protein [Exiguobacterium sibiricum 255-15]AFS70866.1 Acyl carrier protein [Exiguobacterium antarcticum B7]ASI35772.1 acyl carrier protein [Exiguobacterium sp. N4-1P]MCK2156873.1 acyl carrier protein [Exiguobacterium sp. 17-1]MCT4780141.1 acyl carrier protein [Exiguobacterium soli]